MARQAALSIGRTQEGYRLRVEGRGTMQQSKTAEAFVNEVLSAGASRVVVDLSPCDYLDSTFLGCLLGLHRRHGVERFGVAAPPDVRRRLFGPTKIDVLLGVSAEIPAVLGENVDLAAQPMNSREMGRHIMECHRGLAQVPGPQQVTFAAIAEHMAQELNRQA